MASLKGSIVKGVPMFWVPTSARPSVGTNPSASRRRIRYEEDGQLMFAALTFGAAEFALTPGLREGLRA